MTRPVILNFDNSVGSFDKSLTLDLASWQDSIRFSTKWRDFHNLETLLLDQLPYFSAVVTITMLATC